MQVQYKHTVPSSLLAAGCAPHVNDLLVPRQYSFVRWGDVEGSDHPMMAKVARD